MTARTEQSRHAATPRPDRLGPLVQYALLAGPLLSMLDSSIVNVAVEPIARELHAGLTTVQWTVSGYLLALGAGLAGTAYLARRFGTLPVYRASVAAFTLASALCALAPDAGILVAARVLQGLVGAPLVPLAMSMLLGRASGASGASGASRDISPAAGIMLFLGPALGPTVGGALIGVDPHTGWRAIFLINVPFGALAAVAVRRVPAGLAPGRTPGARFDLPGLILLAAGLTGLLLGASQGENGSASGWASPATLAPLTAGAVLLAAYAGWARRRDQPALDLSLARQAVTALSMALSALASVVTWAAVFLLPVFMQSVQGRSALAAGLTLLPQGLITGLSTALAPRLLTGLTIRVTVLAGFTVLAAASLGLLGVGAATPLWLIALILACRSVSIGLVINPLLQALTEPLRPDQLGDANTLFNTWQRIAGSFGIGLLAALYATQARVRGPVPALHLTGAVLALIAAAGAVAALALPKVRNTALERGSTAAGATAAGATATRAGGAARPRARRARR
ncbi:MAG TPA: DHA2 family efflux MFS transporter permease subunit [Streptosporangiaceae bacterium]|nr:DHA2 family efflux MFS transporter permease subunit [Streptosporangiaceae bacterium]